MSFLTRTSELPDFARHEAARRRKYTKEITLADREERVRYRLSRPTSVGEDDGYVRRTEFFGWLVSGRKRIGAFELRAYDAVGCFNNHEFLEIMDLDEEFEARLSRVICDCWNDVPESLSVYGPIVDFRSAWISPDASNRKLFSLAGNAILGTVFSDCSCVIMKAFPLEYQGEAPDGSPLENRLQLRQLAMVRYYRRVFGVEPLPGAYGSEFWLWRRGEIDIDPPIAGPRKGKAIQRS